MVKRFRTLSIQQFAIESLEPRRFFSDTFAITQVSALPAQSSEYGPTNLTAFGNDLLFQATDPASGDRRVWISDGTAAGTRVLPIAETGDQLLVAVNAGAIFVAVSPATVPVYPDVEDFPQLPSELFVTTNQGKTLTDLGPLPAGAGDSSFATDGTETYFAVGREIWKTDGTLTGTQLFVTDSPYTTPDGALRLLNNNILFVGTTAINLTTGAQTVFSPENAVANVTILNGAAYFVASTSNSSTASYDLFRSDGTTAVDLYATAPAGSTLPDIFDMQAIGNQLLLFGYASQSAAGSGNEQIYTCDGTIASIRSLPITLPTSDTADQFFPNDAVFDGKAVFSDTAGELRISDGTAAGTQSVLSLSGQQGFTVVNDILFASTTNSYDIFNGLASNHIGPGQVFVLGRTATATLPGSNAVLTATLTQVKTRSIAVAGDAMKVTVSIANSGNIAAMGTVSLSLYAADDGLLSDAVAIATGLSLNVAGLAPGRSRSFGFRFTLPQEIATGGQKLIAVLNQGTGNSTASAATTVNATPVVRTFGSTVASAFGGVYGPDITVQTSAGVALRFTLHGPGTAAFAINGTDSYVLQLNGTSRSAITIAPVARGASDTISSLTVVGVLGQLLAPRVTFTNASLSFDSNLSRLSVGNLNSSNVAIEGSVPIRISAGVITKTSIGSSGPITSFSADSWTPSVPFAGLQAPSIGTVTVTGAMGANMTAGSIGAIRVGSLQGDVLSQGNIGPITAGSIDQADILAGINLGIDNYLGGGTEVFSAASIAAIHVGTEVRGSLIAAGLSVSDNTFPPTGDESLIPGSKIGPVTIGTLLDNSSQILSANFPATASIDRQRVKTATDPRFKAIVVSP